MDLEMAMSLLQNSKFAYHAYPDEAYQFIAKHFSNQEICKLTEVHLQRPNYVNFAAQYNSTFVEFLKIALVLL